MHWFRSRFANSAKGAVSRQPYNEGTFRKGGANATRFARVPQKAAIEACKTDAEMSITSRSGTFRMRHDSGAIRLSTGLN
jgi:hypothetical protein